jgi:hypothetical protein
MVLTRPSGEIPALAALDEIGVRFADGPSVFASARFDLFVYLLVWVEAFRTTALRVICSGGCTQAPGVWYVEDSATRATM